MSLFSKYLLNTYFVPRAAVSSGRTAHGDRVCDGCPLGRFATARCLHWASVEVPASFTLLSQLFPSYPGALLRILCEVYMVDFPSLWSLALMFLWMVVHP